MWLCSAPWQHAGFTVGMRQDPNYRNNGHTIPKTDTLRDRADTEGHPPPVNIRELIRQQLATGAFASYRAIADRVASLGHQVPKESSIEHWGAGYAVKRLPANEAIVGLADALRLPPTEVRKAFLTSMGVLSEETEDEPVLISLLPDKLRALDNRPDLLGPVVEVVTMAVEKAIREEAAPPAPAPPAPRRSSTAKPAAKKTPAKRATKTVTGTRRNRTNT